MDKDWAISFETFEWNGIGSGIINIGLFSSEPNNLTSPDVLNISGSNIIHTYSALVLNNTEIHKSGFRNNSEYLVGYLNNNLHITLVKIGDKLYFSCVNYKSKKTYASLISLSDVLSQNLYFGLVGNGTLKTSGNELNNIPNYPKIYNLRHHISDTGFADNLTTKKFEELKKKAQIANFSLVDKNNWTLIKTLQDNESKIEGNILKVDCKFLKEGKTLKIGDVSFLGILKNSLPSNKNWVFKTKINLTSSFYIEPVKVGLCNYDNLNKISNEIFLMRGVLIDSINNDKIYVADYEFVNFNPKNSDGSGYINFKIPKETYNLVFTKIDNFVRFEIFSGSIKQWDNIYKLENLNNLGIFIEQRMKSTHQQDLDKNIYMNIGEFYIEN